MINEMKHDYSYKDTKGYLEKIFGTQESVEKKKNETLDAVIVQAEEAEKGSPSI